MPRYRRRRYAKKTTRPTDRIIRAGTVSLTAATQEIGYIYEATDPLTVTNLKLDTGLLEGAAGGPIPYVIVHIPEGYSANNLTYPAITSDLYNPTKNVMLSGVLVNSAYEDHKYTRYSRKMAPGDRIALIYLNPNATIAETVGYEISFTTVH